MRILLASAVFFSVLSNISQTALAYSVHRAKRSSTSCRNIPGDAGFPSDAEWSQLNDQVGGRLLKVVPSAQYCEKLPCTPEQWTSWNFRTKIPGAMVLANMEQDYDSNPPSLCVLNDTTCGQGRVPVYGINVTSVSDIQAGISFANKHNLRVAIKSSGHDLLGRSSQKGSLLIWTHYLQNITFTDHFVVDDNHDLGSAVTVGAAVPLRDLYAAAKNVGKFVVAGTAANVALGGGYGQGAGHSAFSPYFGLAADNCLEYKVVLANGSFVTANEVENPDLFWAMRGGGAGTWGVVYSATFRTFPIFSAAYHFVNITAPNVTAAGALGALHGRHIFDWDDMRAGQYASFVQDYNSGGYTLILNTFFPYVASEDVAKQAMSPLLQDAQNAGYGVWNESVVVDFANNLVRADDDPAGNDVVLGSRLIPANAYENNLEDIAKAFEYLLQQPYIFTIATCLVAGGQVAANIDNAVTPKWRSAKTHIFFIAAWLDSMPLSVINEIRHNTTQVWVPALSAATGDPHPGAYSNEADAFEPDFQTTFYGDHYAQLSKIKMKYDPEDLFIVHSGVGSERWDVDGICRV